MVGNRYLLRQVYLNKVQIKQHITVRLYCKVSQSMELPIKKVNNKKL